MKKITLLFAILKIPVDFLMILLAGIIAYFLRFTPFFTQLKPIYFSLNLRDFLLFLVLADFLTILILALSGLYQVKKIKAVEESSRILVATAAALLVINFSTYLSQNFFVSRFILLVSWFLGVVFLIVGRGILTTIQSFLVRKYKIGLNKIVLVGNGTATQILKHYIRNNPALGYRIVKNFRKLNLQKIEKEMAHLQIDDLILCKADATKKQILALFNLCSQKSVNFRFVPTNFQALTAGLEMETLAGLPLLEAKRTPLEGWRRIVKRIFDLIFGSLFLVLLTPVFLIVPFLIKWDSEGPIFARIPHRVGKGGSIFFMYKFRSMIKGADKIKKELLKFNEREKGKGPLFKMKNDPRITKIGKFLRKYRIDEFPQLINVLKGEMSLVGPRAHEVAEVAKYRKNHKIVFAIKPGITGLAQISGSSDLPFDEENKLDLYYIEHWSLWLDIKILIKTFLFVFTDRSAC